MPDAQPPRARGPVDNPLRLCPDCGGILEPTQPSWEAVVTLAAGTGPQAAEPQRWQCLICGYRD